MTIYDHIIIIVSKLQEELTPEEALGKTGWKVYYKDNKIVKMKQFSKSGYFTGTLDEIPKLKEDAEAQKQSQTKEEKSDYKIHIYSHIFYYYNKEGLLTKQEDFDKEQKLKYRFIYYYDKKNQRIRIETTSLQEKPFRITEEFSYDTDGILIKEERIENGKNVSLTQVTFHNKKYHTTANTYTEDSSLKSNTDLKKLSDGPEQGLCEERSLNPIESKLVDRGHRVVQQRNYDIDNTIERMQKFFYNDKGYILCEKSYIQRIPGIYFDSFYVYYYNDNKQLYKQHRYSVDKEDNKIVLKLFTEIDYFYDKSIRLVKKIRRHPLVDEEHEETYSYNKKGQLVKIINSQLSQRELFFYDRKGRKIRQETHYRDEHTPMVEKWRYNKDGKMVESEFSMSITVP